MEDIEDFLDPRYESPHYDAACRLKRLGATPGARLVLDRTHMPKPVMAADKAAMYTLADLDFEFFSVPMARQSKKGKPAIIANPRVRVVNEPGKSTLVVVSEERSANLLKAPAGNYPLTSQLVDASLEVRGPFKEEYLRYRAAGPDIDIFLEDMPICRFPRKLAKGEARVGLRPFSTCKSLFDNDREWLGKQCHYHPDVAFRCWDEGIRVVVMENEQPKYGFRSPEGPEPNEFWLDMARRAEFALMKCEETIPQMFCIVADTDIDKPTAFCQPLRDQFAGYCLCDISVISKAVSPADARAGHSKLTREQWSRPEARVVVLVPNEGDFMFMVRQDSGGNRLITAIGAYATVNIPGVMETDIKAYEKRVAKGVKQPCYPARLPEMDILAVQRLLQSDTVEVGDTTDMLDFLAAATM